MFIMIALERTYLAYIRTANTLANLAVVVNQLFALKQNHKTLGKVYASIMIGTSIIIACLGAGRHFSATHTMIPRTKSSNGRITTPTLYLVFAGGLTGLICCGLFVTVLVVR
jgi:uncharacterized membrane protein YidH (DUF202 family)